MLPESSREGMDLTRYSISMLEQFTTTCCIMVNCVCKDVTCTACPCSQFGYWQPLDSLSLAGLSFKSGLLFFPSCPMMSCMARHSLVSLLCNQHQFPSLWPVSLKHQHVRLGSRESFIPFNSADAL